MSHGTTSDAVLPLIDSGTAAEPSEREKKDGLALIPAGSPTVRLSVAAWQAPAVEPPRLSFR